MKRINNVSRVFAVLIFLVVTSLTAFGYLSLVLDAAAGNAVQNQYRWNDDYRSLDDSQIAAEVHANVSWAADPVTATWRRAVAAQVVSDVVIARLMGRAKGSDRAALSGIEMQHRAAVAAAWNVMRLHARHARNAATVYRTQVLALYEMLSARIETAARSHLAVADVMSARYETLQRQLEFAMIGVGVLGLGVLVGLLHTMHMYRKRADEAMRREFRRLKQAALSDSLTSLGNHRAFREDLAKELSRSRRYGHALTLVLLDVDDFKALNDAQGHAHGDAVLTEAARALESGRLEDRAYRIGGDEFAMLLIETTGAQAKVVLDRLHASLKQRLTTATVSIGFCQGEADFDEHDLYERADAALYAAKRNGRDTIVDFSSIRPHTTIFSARKTAALQALLESRELDVAFQPIWGVARKDILGFEALARPGAHLGFAGPQEAFDVAEHQRRVADLDRLCVEKTLEAVAGLPSNQLVFINVTPETLGRPGFQANRLADAAAAAGLQTRQVAIELTERRITDASEVLQHVTELSDLGFLIALDDTGAGSAGLEILSKFTFDFVKIDRLVIVEAVKHKRARGVLAGIVAIAAEGGSFVIAEGIETIDQLAFLRNLRGGTTPFSGISGVQGYLLGRPRPGRPATEAFEHYGRILAGAAGIQADVAS